MSAEERHFRARTPIPRDQKPVDIRIESRFGTLYARPFTKKGRAFLREHYYRPHEYEAQDIEIQPGRHWEMLQILFREAKVRVQDDNGQEIE